ncbi:hypothetical protein [Stakelama tenebrarum]|uniref:Uncharacterized protein n=1 Tax=Stakelama tenebrarum TaxID=2711215 RepID=A0A6G6Y5Z0_9SPHN|nr:hypothetical protein [Sphingosinithalassobacter tenebrarum]QIG79996.1 hypothetical protein G5C33_09550 [Sphingosinithalassobacter tenebrarum]
METRIISVREEAGFEGSFALFYNNVRVDITGWSFALELRRQAGTAADIDLGDAADVTADGMWPIDAADGEYSIRIAPATLAGVADTTGDFTLHGVLYATEPADTVHAIEAYQFNVEKGPGA